MTEICDYAERVPTTRFDLCESKADHFYEMKTMKGHYLWARCDRHRLLPWAISVAHMISFEDFIMKKVNDFVITDEFRNYWLLSLPDDPSEWVCEYTRCESTATNFHEYESNDVYYHFMRCDRHAMTNANAHLKDGLLFPYRRLTVDELVLRRIFAS